MKAKSPAAALMTNPTLGISVLPSLSYAVLRNVRIRHESVDQATWHRRPRLKGLPSFDRPPHGPDNHGEKADHEQQRDR